VLVADLDEQVEGGQQSVQVDQRRAGGDDDQVDGEDRAAADRRVPGLTKAIRMDGCSQVCKAAGQLAIWAVVQ
jgi:hypothetical protein